MAKDISFHITDIFINSVKADATEVRVEVRSSGDSFGFRISDNGCGMSPHRLEEIVSAVSSEQSSGWGIILLKQSLEYCGGDFHIESVVGEGTVVEARFPMGGCRSLEVGDLAATLAMIMTGTPGVRVALKLVGNGGEFEISTSDLESVAQGLPLSHTRITTHLRKFFAEQFSQILGE